MELQFKKEKQELSESLTQLENHKVDLTSSITDHQIILKEQEDAYKKLNEEYKQLEVQLQECKVNLEVAEKKVEETEKEIHKNMGSKDEKVAELEQLVEDIRRDLEEKEEEHSTLVDNVRTIEVKLRLSNQKLRVTEQLLTEKEEAFRITELKFQQEQRVLEDRITRLSGIIAANNEAHQRMITDISEGVNSTLTGMEIVIQKFEDDYKNYENCILEMSNELHISKNWVIETNKEKKQLMKEVEHLVVQLKDNKDKELALRERVEKLEVKASKEEAENEKLSKAVNQLEKMVAELGKTVKEKDDGMLGLGEEKREAIRQLCLWIDYQRSRYDYLKEMLSKVAARGQRAS
nr:hypothetical protein CFP56_47331 [Quercus suber]